MKTGTGFIYGVLDPDLVRVSIPRYVFKGNSKDNLRFRLLMSIWIRENCKRAAFEYPDEVSIYPHALWIAEDLALIFKLKWAI